MSKVQISEASKVQIFLTEAELMQRWRYAIKARTLRDWRQKNRGPAYLKAGQKILYPVAELTAWEQSQFQGGH